MSTRINERMRDLLAAVAEADTADGWARLDVPDLGGFDRKWRGWQHAYHGGTWTAALDRGFIEYLRRTVVVAGHRFKAPVAVRLTRRGRAALGVEVRP